MQAVSSEADLLHFSKEVEKECSEGLSAPRCQLEVVLQLLTEHPQVFRDGVSQGYLQNLCYIALYYTILHIIIIG